MQELMKKKQEIDRLYKEAKAMEFTVNAAAQDTIDKALAALDEVLDQVGDDFGPGYTIWETGITGWLTLSMYGAREKLQWTLHINPCKAAPVLYSKYNGKWVCNIATPEQKRGAAEIIMYYWPRFMELVKAGLENQIKNDMQKKLDEVGRMVDFLQRAEKFKI